MIFFCDIGVDQFTVSFILGSIFVIADAASFAVRDRVGWCSVWVVYVKWSYTPRESLNIIKWLNSDCGKNA